MFSRKILEGPVTERKKTPVQPVVKSRGKINPIISLPSWEVVQLCYSMKSEYLILMLYDCCTYFYFVLQKMFSADGKILL